MTAQSKERRRGVRLRPMPELPATARLLDGDVPLQVWDVSVGGVAVVSPPAEAGLEPDTRHRIELDLGRYGTFELLVEVRHCSDDAVGTTGMQVIDPPAQVLSAMGHYVAELLERGGLS